MNRKCLLTLPYRCSGHRDYHLPLCQLAKIQRAVRRTLTRINFGLQDNGSIFEQFSRIVVGLHLLPGNKQLVGEGARSSNEVREYVPILYLWPTCHVRDESLVQRVRSTRRPTVNSCSLYRSFPLHPVTRNTNCKFLQPAALRILPTRCALFITKHFAPKLEINSIHHIAHHGDWHSTYL